MPKVVSLPYETVKGRDVVAHIFISYATGHELFLAHDLRDGISVGEQRKQRRYAELRQVDAVIGVVMKSFLGSE